MTRKEAASLGGKAVTSKRAPDVCPRCGSAMRGRSWHSFLGHLGLHRLADRFFGGDLDRCQQHLMQNGLARQDPNPENGAWRGYVPIGRQETRLGFHMETRKEAP